MAEESVKFPQDDADAVDEMYQPLKLAPEYRKVVLGDEEYEVRAEIEADLFEIAADKISKMSSLRCFTEELLPVMLDDIDMRVIRAQIDARQVRPVDIMKGFSPAVEKLALALESRAKSIQRKRRALPK